MEIEYQNHITVEEYNTLRQSVGWNRIEAEQAQTGLSNSTYQVKAVHGEEVVGMARLISDGGYVVLIADVIVRPDYQGKGVGKGMITRILEKIKGSLKDGQCVFINLMAAEGREPFYRQFGFLERPAKGSGAGMSMKFQKHDGAFIRMD
ncbi:GNAT family N-acetyltransferase [Caproiciproducens galactitolivorans]|uniref:GNAT family N-acetyltransferase n=1 Tax=Caproiciproducens galactitolivorans TaxID=642589 RepID=A0ABT4BWS1_9FIRM|nr:GNAT family N-acetyltransferase [Caproiciproducens galactitolivorans]MCY1715245.1 GNAT family N-acetyltransferase [Caproiciproducens galactitolivorans]